MFFLRILFLIISGVILAGCGGKSVWAPDDVVAQRRYVSNEPPYLMLKTMINTRTGSGGHSALVINGSELIMYDPAGRWFHSWAPERNDVLFGMEPALMRQYDSFHARNTHHVVTQKIFVTPEVAAKAMRLALAAGPSVDAQCAKNTSFMLRQLPGFEHIRQTWFPAKLMKDFENLPGVQTTKYFEDDVGKNNQ